ncbi:MAG: sigma-54 dependent transcriptional regulator [Candidatus Wallbacteria bacterium]|nr:sigma-54 dependent transcriptional regulator [Candidatus Wallbacteria bacterium]
MYRVWIIEDEESLRMAEAKYVERLGYLVSAFPDAESARDKLATESPQAVFLDLKLPGMGGEEFLPILVGGAPEARVIVVSAYSEVENIVSVIQKGAHDFIRKPFNIDEFGHKLSKAMEFQTLLNENNFLKSRQQFNFLQCGSQAMRKIEEQVCQVAGTPGNSTVLLCGESGTGKEIVAKWIHRETKYSTGRFVELNCSSIPENLLESELFGHEKGAFTDAYQEKAGLFELAAGGTLLLDEIGDMPPKLQAKLLKVLESKEVKRVGGVKPQQVDLRIIAATNRELTKEVGEGRFRQDLYFRLNVFPMLVPPLRERKDDIIPLADYFVAGFNREFRKKIQGMTRDANNELLNYDWPGNVRELRNVIERNMIVSCSEFLDSPVLAGINPGNRHSGEIVLPHGGISLEDTMNSLEKEYISKALEASGWNQSKAAQLLGIPREILRYRMKKYELV